MRKFWLATLFLAAPCWGQDLPIVEPAGTYTCADVRWASVNLSESTIEAIKARMTPEQLAQAKRCLLRRIKK